METLQSIINIIIWRRSIGFVKTLYRRSIRYYGDSVNLFGSFIFYCYLCNIDY